MVSRLADLYTQLSSDAEKIQQAAAKAEMNVADFCDENFKSFEVGSRSSLLEV